MQSNLLGYLAPSVENGPIPSPSASCEQRDALLRSAYIRRCIDVGQLSSDQIATLTNNQAENLACIERLPTIRHLLLGKGESLSFDRLLNLSPDQRSNLQSAQVMKLFEVGTFSIEWVLGLSPDQRLTIESSEVAALVRGGQLSLAQMLALTPEQRLKLEQPSVVAKIGGGLCDVEQVLGECDSVQASDSVRQDSGDSLALNNHDLPEPETAKNIKGASCALPQLAPEDFDEHRWGSDFESSDFLLEPCRCALD